MNIKRAIGGPLLSIVFLIFFAYMIAGLQCYFKNLTGNRIISASAGSLSDSTAVSTAYLVNASSGNNLSADISQAINFFSYIQQILEFNPDKRVEVDISEQRMKMFEGDRLINEFSVSTGSPDSPTPIGNFKIYDKFVMVDSKADGCWLPFWAGFTQDGLYGFHEVPICSEGRRGSDQIGTQASTGCIRLSVEDSEAFYNWVQVGTPIIIKNN